MRAGMFVTATFYGQHGRVYPIVPTDAVLHLHDRDWVFVPAADNHSGEPRSAAEKLCGMQEITAGLKPGQQVVSNALAVEAESQQ